jgi:hypothetical protein
MRVRDLKERTEDPFESLFGSSRGSNRPPEAPPTPGSITAIAAVVTDNNEEITEHFDALPYVRALTDEDLRTLVEVERGGWCADEGDIASTLPLTGSYDSMQPGVRRVAAFVDLDNEGASGWLVVRLDRAHLVAYVRVERPHLQLDFTLLYADDE